MTSTAPYAIGVPGRTLVELPVRAPDPTANALVVTAPSPLPAVAKPPPTALELIRLGLRLDDTLYKASRFKGKDGIEPFEGPYILTAIVTGLGAIVGGGVVSGKIFGWETPIPLFLGLLASAATVIPGFIGAWSWAQKRQRTAVVPEKAAQAFVDAFVGGDALSRRVVKGDAARWHELLSRREVAGVFVRRQLEELSKAPLSRDAKADTMASAVTAIVHSLRSDKGGPVKSLSGEALRAIEDAVKKLDGDDRREVSAFLVATLYKNERPRIPVEDHGQSQTLLATLASLQPFKGLSSEHLATLDVGRSSEL